MSKTKIISEIGWNHMGDMDRAKRYDFTHQKKMEQTLLSFKLGLSDRLKKRAMGR